MKLSDITAKAIFSVAFISVFLTFLIAIIFQFNNFKQEIKHIKTDYIELKKEQIKREVLKVYYTIDKKEKEIVSDIKNKLRDEVLSAHKTAMNIYLENKDNLSNEQIKYLIVTTLKNKNFLNKRFYFFINTNKGKPILFNKESKLYKDENIWNLKDVKGNFFIQNQATIALKKGEGFLRNYFVKPDIKDNKQYEKISFVKNFKPFNWHIGIGEYVEDIRELTKKKILKEIAQTRYDKDGYIFVNRIDKKALVFDGKYLGSPKEYKNEELFKKQVEAINSKDKYFYYNFKKLDSDMKYRKVSYVRYYKDWKWIIGSGVYIDEINEEINLRSSIHDEMVIKQTLTLLILLFILIIFIYFISQKLSNYLKDNIDNLLSSFKEASKNYEPINPDNLGYKEFKGLARSLNKTLNSRNKVLRQLEDYVHIVNENVIISSTNEKGIITEVSEAFCKITGYSKDELIGKPHNIIRHPSMSKEFYKELWRKIKKGEIWRGELKNKTKNGNTYWVYMVINPIFKDEKIIGYTAIKHDITAKKKVEYLSITDELTNLYNRRHFNEVIEIEINRAKRENHSISLLMLDVDYFKKYNDTYGHHKGDKALSKIASVLHNNTNRANDFAFRLGGEEFAIITTSKTSDEILKYANKIRTEIINLEIEHEKNPIYKYITCSIGVIHKDYNQLDVTSKDLYKLADEALYTAKSKGRNQTILYE